MGADWTSDQRNSVSYGYRWPDGSVDRCANDPYSIVRVSIDGLSQMGITVTGVPAMSPEYLGALASALDESRNRTQNAPYAAACRQAASAPSGTSVSPTVLQAIVWSAYYFQGDNGVVGAGSPANVALESPVTPPLIGQAIQLPTNGQLNDSACTPGGAAPPGGPVAGWSPNILLVLGLIVAGTMAVNAANARTVRRGK